MKITRDNYEIWFLDYLEGRLNDSEKEELHQFLASHHDLAAELDEYIPTISADGSIVYPDKEMLKKETYNDPALFETAVVAAMEGDLNKEELHSLEKWLTKNPEELRFFRELEKTKLKPDLSIIFPAKNRLKKRTAMMTLWIRVATAAAILLLAMFLYDPGKKESIPENQTISASISPQPNIPAEKFTTDTQSASKSNKENQVKRQTATIYRRKSSKQIASIHKPAETRQPEHLEILKSRSYPMISIFSEFTDLLVLKSPEIPLCANIEITLSDFLNNKLQEMKANGPKGFMTREEVALAGLHLFSRLPGNHLTGRKGTDGRLTSISLNTQLLAISIPVNR